MADIDTIYGLHSYALVADPNSTWGVLDGNPLHETISESVSLCPPDFLVNVTLIADEAVTAFFAGHLLNEPSALELLRSNPSPNAAPIEVRE